jgi:hypothetical protein
MWFPGSIDPGSGISHSLYRVPRKADPRVGGRTGYRDCWTSTAMFSIASTNPCSSGTEGELSGCRRDVFLQRRYIPTMWQMDLSCVKSKGREDDTAEGTVNLQVTASAFSNVIHRRDSDCPLTFSSLKRSGLVPKYLDQ